MPKLFRVLVLCSAALSGCTSIPLTSMVKLSRIDFMTTDLKLFRFALTMPNDLRPQPGGVHMDLAYQQGDKPEEKRVVKLEESKEPRDLVGLPQAPQGKKTYVYRLPASEVTTLNQIRNDAAAAKSQGKNGSLTMGIAAKEFCTINKLPDAPLLVTSFVLSSENIDYIVLTRDIDLRSDPTISESLDHLAPCAN
jgi:hypothetical protein